MAGRPSFPAPACSTCWATSGCSSAPCSSCAWSSRSAAKGSSAVSLDHRCTSSSGAGRRNHGYVGGCYLVTLIINIANVHRQVSTTDPAQHARSLRARQVLVAPLLQPGEYHLQFRSGRGEPVGEPRPGAWLLVGLALHHSVVHQRRQPVRQHVRGDAQVVTELRELRRAHERLAQDEERPPFAEDAKAARDRAGRLRNLSHVLILPPELVFPTQHARFGKPTQQKVVP